MGRVTSRRCRGMKNPIRVEDILIDNSCYGHEATVHLVDGLLAIIYSLRMDALCLCFRECYVL
jgi:hypothetical protein